MSNQGTSSCYQNECFGHLKSAVTVSEKFAVTVLSDGSLDASFDLLDGIDQDEALSLLGAADTSPSSHMNINAFVIEAGKRTIAMAKTAKFVHGRCFVAGIQPRIPLLNPVYYLSMMNKPKTTRYRTKNQSFKNAGLKKRRYLMV